MNSSTKGPHLRNLSVKIHHGQKSCPRIGPSTGFSVFPSKAYIAAKANGQLSNPAARESRSRRQMNYILKDMAAATP
jgi:hypothetical protein